MGGVGGSLFTGEAVLGVLGEDLLRPPNRRPILPPRPLDALLKESTCAGGLHQCPAQKSMLQQLDRRPSVSSMHAGRLLVSESAHAELCANCQHVAWL